MTEKEKEEFILWHESRLKKCRYPKDICTELRFSRDKFLKRKK